MQIKIDENLKSLIPPLSQEERDQLEENLKAEGCRDPLVVWNGVLLDGHNRHEICTRLGIEYKIHEIDLPSLEAAQDWMDANQLGRRNLTPEQFTLLLGRRYNRAKKSQGGTGANQHSEQTGQSGQSAGTSAHLATEHGVSERTVRRAGQYASAVEALEQALPGAIEPGSAPPRRAVVEAAKLVEKDPQQAARVLAGELKPHVANNSGNNEWYTPPEFIEAARAAMGSIDVDPASSEIANRTVQAGKFYTAEDDGLAHEWRGNIWMNPPYAQPLISQFAEALVEKTRSGETEQACALVNNGTETRWFQMIAMESSAICFIASRVKFVDPEGNPRGAPLQGQAVLYIGDAPDRFAKEFSRFGLIVEVPRNEQL